MDFDHGSWFADSTEGATRSETGFRPDRLRKHMIWWSIENLFFVSNWSQARITVAQPTMLVALSLLAPPMAGVQSQSTPEPREDPRESGNIQGCPPVRSGALCSPELGVVRRPRPEKVEKRRRGTKRTKAEVRWRAENPSSAEPGVERYAWRRTGTKKKLETRRCTEARLPFGSQVRFKA